MVSGQHHGLWQWQKTPNGCLVEFAWGQFFKRGYFDDETCEELKTMKLVDWMIMGLIVGMLPWKLTARPSKNDA